jgi:hypothetical protein
MPSTSGQRLGEPLIRALPVFGFSLHETATVTAVVWRALTSKLADPLQVVPLSVLVPDKLTE